jgi:membrane protease YdiL (CAAX protease family)
VTPLSKSKTLFGLLLTLGVGSLPFPVWDDELKDVPHMLGNEAIYWALVVATLAYVVVVEKRPLTSIGLRKPGVVDAFIGLAFAVAIIAGLAALYLLVLPVLHLDETQAFDTLAATPVWWLAISVVRAGVSEEILFRGYPIERLQELTGNGFVAAILPLVLFSLAHVGPWGWTHLLIAGFGGAMFTVLYFWRRNLWVNIVAHILVDGIGLLAA